MFRAIGVCRISGTSPQRALAAIRPQGAGVPLRRQGIPRTSALDLHEQPLARFVDERNLSQIHAASLPIEF